MHWLQRILQQCTEQGEAVFSPIQHRENHKTRHCRSTLRSGVGLTGIKGVILLLTGILPLVKRRLSRINDLFISGSFISHRKFGLSEQIVQNIIALLQFCIVGATAAVPAGAAGGPARRGWRRIRGLRRLFFLLLAWGAGLSVLCFFGGRSGPAAAARAPASGPSTTFTYTISLSQ